MAAASSRPNSENLLTSLERARWGVALRTFGSSHATLIGLLVDWWVSGAPRSRWALEGGPSFGYRSRGVRGGGQCDAILGEGQSSKGIVEVEGSRYEDTLLKIGKFFGAEHSDLATLEFGVFLAYATGPQGRGPMRTIHPLPLDTYIAIGKRITKEHPGKQLAILVLDKEYERQGRGSRARSEYYAGRPDRISGSLIQDGEQVASQPIVPMRL